MATQYIKKGSAPRAANGAVGIAVNSSNELEIRQVISGVDTISKIPMGVSGGATAVASAVAVDKIGTMRQTTFTFTNLPITVRDTEQGGGIKFFDFAAGRILFLGAVAKDIKITTTSALASTLHAGVTGNFGVGTTTQASATLATTEQNLIPKTDFTSSATINVAPAAVDSALVTNFQLDGTGTAIDLFFNVAVAGAGDIDGNATVVVNGTVTVSWIDLGND